MRVDNVEAKAHEEEIESPMMLVESAISATTVLLVAARAVNILR